MIASTLMDFRNLSRRDLESWAVDQGMPAFRGRQLFRWLWRPCFQDFSQITDFPKAMRQRMPALGTFYSLRTLTEEISRDGTRKWAFRLIDGQVVETVLIPEQDHSTICVSTQVGCAMGCKFCYTAKMGLMRDLSPSEIAGQVLRVIEQVDAGKRPRNIVFMGMGEPLANYDNLLKSLEILLDDTGLNFSSRRITVSTCGLVPEIERLGRDTNVGLAISLHAPDDQVRSRIMPVNRRYSLTELVAACKRYNLSPRRRITFEYLLLGGVTDRPVQARLLAELLRDIPAKINLIPFNEIPKIGFKQPEPRDVLAFQEIMKQANYTTIIRKSRGRDISAACGQLYASVEKRHDERTGKCSIVPWND